MDKRVDYWYVPIWEMDEYPRKIKATGDDHAVQVASRHFRREVKRLCLDLGVGKYDFVYSLFVYRNKGFDKYNMSSDRKENVVGNVSGDIVSVTISRKDYGN